MNKPVIRAFIQDRIRDLNPFDEINDEVLVDQYTCNIINSLSTSIILDRVWFLVGAIVINTVRTRVRNNHG